MLTGQHNESDRVICLNNTRYMRMADVDPGENRHDDYEQKEAPTRISSHVASVAHPMMSPELHRDAALPFDNAQQKAQPRIRPSRPPPIAIPGDEHTTNDGSGDIKVLEGMPRYTPNRSQIATRAHTNIQSLRDSSRRAVSYLQDIYCIVSEINEREKTRFTSKRRQRLCSILAICPFVIVGVSFIIIVMGVLALTIYDYAVKHFVPHIAPMFKT